jgi:hypothetical protein
LQVKVTLMLIRYLPYEQDYQYEQDEAAGLAEPAESLMVSVKREPAGLSPALEGT